MPGRRVLLVEGKDDEHVLKHICGNRGIQELDGVIPHDGAEDLLDAFSGRLKANNEPDNIFGVVIDADTNVDARWQSIQSLLSQFGYENIPPDPKPTGTILDPPGQTMLPKVGIWIMPDNQTPGILENFLRFLIPQPSDLLDHVTASVDRIPDRRFGQNDQPKVIIHTWLAWQSDPGNPYGTAITARFLDPDLPEADVLVSWLNRLFYP